MTVKNLLSLINDDIDIRIVNSYRSAKTSAMILKKSQHLEDETIREIYITVGGALIIELLNDTWDGFIE